MEHQRKDVDHLGFSEIWLSILTRKLLRSPNFPDLPALQCAILQFIAECNEIAHPFRWTAASFENVLAKIDAALSSNPHLLAVAA